MEHRITGFILLFIISEVGYYTFHLFYPVNASHPHVLLQKLYLSFSTDFYFYILCVCVWGGGGGGAFLHNMQ